MKSFIRLFSLCLFIFGFLIIGVEAQDSPAKKAVAKNSKPAPKNESGVVAKAETPPSEKEKVAFEEAQNAAVPAEKVEKLSEFLKNYPRSTFKARAQELLVGARAEFGDGLLQAGDRENGVKQFQQALKDAPATVSDKLFVGVLARIPANIFFLGDRAAALEIAKKIEEKAAGSPERMLALAQFYTMIEDASEARRLSEKAADLQPDSAAAQMSIGMANRIDFRLEAAAQNFSRALEIDGKSLAAKRNLADAQRGLGQNEDAARLYREILSETPEDDAARSGLILALFGTGERADAENLLNEALTKNSRNYPLLASVAYWYAAKGEGAKAVEYGQKAVDAEPRYTWAHIALARGLLLEKRPLDAEKALLVAKSYGNFPTLDYELAAVRAAAGFYEEAAADLRRSFQLKNGLIETRLAGRSLQQGNSFNELLALERRAAILQPVSAESEENAERLKKLLIFSSALGEKTKNETLVSEAAKEFSAGDDAARVHRQLYAANRLLMEKVALAEAFELTQAAVSGVDDSIKVPAPAAATMADELYEARKLALAQGGVVGIPEIPAQTLTNILRGRIEGIAGWTLFQQEKTDEAVVRLKRAVGILPENSAWWRLSQWRLGIAYEKNGKLNDALEAYIKSYRVLPHEANRQIIESLYQQIYGSLDGFEDRLNGRARQTRNNTANAGGEQQTNSAAGTVFKNPLPSIIAEINPPKSAQTTETKQTASASEAPASLSEPPTKAEIAPEKTASETQNESAPDLTKNAVEPEKAAETTVTETKPETKAETTAEANTVQAAPESSEASPETKVDSTVSQPENGASESEVKTDVSSPPAEKKDAEPQIVEAKAENVSNNDASPADADSEKKQNSVEALPTPTPMTETVAEKSGGNENAETVKTESTAVSENKKLETLATNAPRPRVILIDRLSNTVTEIPATPVEKNKEKAANPDKALSSQTEAPKLNPNVTIKKLDFGNGETRSRVACALWTNQDSISVLSNGGTVAVLVAVEGAVSLENLKISVSNPLDIEIKPTEQESETKNRKLYEVRSISENKGIFTISFESPCGKKEVKIRVR